MLVVGVVVLIIAFALHIAWIAKLAAARGRSVVLWIAIGMLAGAVGVRVGWSIAAVASESDTDAVMLLGALAPLPTLIVPMVIVALALYRLPVHVELRRTWPVHSSAHGAGRLVISRETLMLEWADRRDEIARADVKAALVDGECLRLRYAAGEMLLMPMAEPQSRVGRISQSKTLARLLAT